MCELLGMSSNHPTSINVSLSTLAERGEAPKMHGDGWGIAFYEGKDVRLIKDAGEAKDSPWVPFIKERNIVSHEIIAHIRKSTVGEVTYSNTHPFIRELAGRMHTFAHNGTLSGIHEREEFNSSSFRPVGKTDSERSFCYLMELIKPLWSKGKIPELEDRIKIVHEFSVKMRELGPTNFLYSDGDALFAHGHHRHDPIKDKIIWPGLFFHSIHCDSKSSHGHEITMFASVPLNDGHWVPLEAGELMVIRRGEVIHRR